MTEVTYLGSVHGTQAALRRMLPRDRGNGRPGRLGARATAASRCRRRTAAPSTPSRASGVPARGAAAPALERRADDRAAPRAEHPAVHWVRARTEGAATGRARLPARGGGARDRLGGHARPARALGRRADRLHDLGQAPDAVGGRAVPGPHGGRRPADGRAAGPGPAATTSSPPLDDDRDHGAHGPFDAEAHARSPQLWLSLHRRAALGAAAAAAAGIAGAVAARRS